MNTFFYCERAFCRFPHFEAVHLKAAGLGSVCHITIFFLNAKALTFTKSNVLCRIGKYIFKKKKWNTFIACFSVQTLAEAVFEAWVLLSGGFSLKAFPQMKGFPLDAVTWLKCTNVPECVTCRLISGCKRLVKRGQLMEKPHAAGFQWRLLTHKHADSCFMRWSGTCDLHCWSGHLHSDFFNIWTL